jgi:hypothetical protein
MIDAMPCSVSKIKKIYIEKEKFLKEVMSLFGHDMEQRKGQPPDVSEQHGLA